MRVVAVWGVVLTLCCCASAQQFKQFVFPGGPKEPDSVAIAETFEAVDDEPEPLDEPVADPGRLSAMPVAPYVMPQPQQPDPYAGYMTPPPTMPPVPVPAPVASTAPPSANYEINYCDKAEFPDSLLAQYELERIDYFVYNKSCSGIFFQCSIGKTFMLRCPSPAQAFDPSIVNCNFRSDNRICPEYDHIVHCTIQESCTENEFACCAHPQKCIDLARRCDGHPDCINGEDENNCPSCARNEFACVKSGKCIPHSKRCDGNRDDCGDGSNLDETGCSRNETCWGKFVCDSAETIATLGRSDCIDYALHCDGQRHCPGGEDELNCRRSDNKYLLCENQKQSVLKEEWCDGQEHCADGSDERYCY